MLFKYFKLIGAIIAIVAAFTYARVGDLPMTVLFSALMIVLNNRLED